MLGTIAGVIFFVAAIVMFVALFLWRGGKMFTFGGALMAAFGLLCIGGMLSLVGWWFDLAQHNLFGAPSYSEYHAPAASSSSRRAAVSRDAAGELVIDPTVAIIAVVAAGAGVVGVLLLGGVGYGIYRWRKGSKQ